MAITGIFLSLLSVQSNVYARSEYFRSAKAILPIHLPFRFSFCIGQSSCLCLQIVWQPSHRRKAGGVLGSPRNEYRGHKTNPNENSIGRRSDYGKSDLLSKNCSFIAYICIWGSVFGFIAFFSMESQGY